MKRILCGALAAAMMTAGALAYQPPHANDPSNIITHEDANCDPQAQAEFLQKLGLFMGTDKGFELDRAMTRAEGAAMLCRFLGGTAEAETGAFRHPFDDVPAWAGNAVGWLYQKKLTYGVSESSYGSSQPLTAEQFSAFLSRAIAGNDDYKDNFLTVREKEELKERDFLRSYAVAMSVRAMRQYVENDAGTYTLAQYLAVKGVYTEEAFAEAAWDVLPPVYDGNGGGTIASIPYADSQIRELSRVLGSDETDRDYFYANRTIDGKFELYRMEWKTLRPTLLISEDANGANIYMQDLGTVGGKDYLLQIREAGGSYRLYSVSGTTAALERSEAGCPVPVESGDAIVLQLADSALRIDETGISSFTPQPAPPSEEQTSDTAETVLLHTGETSCLQQTVTAEGTTIESVDRKTREVLKSFVIPRDLPDDSRTLEKHTDDFRFFYGEAGLYRYDAGTGGLAQLAENAVNALRFSRNGAAVFCLTHEPGKRCYGDFSLGGDTIIRLNLETGEQETLVDASAGVEIAGFTEYDVADGKSCEFYSAGAVGMMHFDRYTYFYDGNTGKITVRDYTAGRPELAKGFDYDHPEDYKKGYVEKEQARLDEAWNGKR